MRVRSILVLIVVATAACTAVERPDAPQPDSLGAVLTLGTERGALIVDSTGAVVSTVGRPVASPDGSTLYTTARDGARTRLDVRDSSSGDLTGSTILDGRLGVRVASITGERVALMRPFPPGIDPTIAVPRARTTIVIADPSGEDAARAHRLVGNFEPEAFSVDDGRLFLIQYLPALAPSSYRVAVLDLATGAVGPVYGRFKSPPERMPGVRLAQVFDPTAEQLYTLYTNRTPAHFHDHWQDASYGDNEVSFVHVLNLREGWAFCAGLPRSLWGQPGSAQAMAPSPDGGTLYVVDSMRQLVAEMDTETLRITRTRHVNLGDPDRGPTSAAVSPDGAVLWVGVAGGVSRIETDTLAVSGRSTFTAPVRGLASSEDGDRLFVALRDGVAVIDPSTGRTIAAPSFPRIESILHVTTS